MNWRTCEILIGVVNTVTAIGLSMEPIYKCNEDAKHHAFGLVKHYIGRLGQHLKITYALLSYISGLSGLLDEFNVLSNLCYLQQME